MTSPTALAAIFDLDGVLTDTAELHYQSWVILSKQLGVPFDRQANEALRGISRMQSLELVLGNRSSEYTLEQKEAFCFQKNEEYKNLVMKMTPADLFPGVRELLVGCREAGIKTSLASSSKNGQMVIDRLEIGELLDQIIDGNDVSESKPNPLVFLTAAKRLGYTPSQCVVVEDAEAGVEAGLAAGMKVIGVGPTERVGKAHRVVDGVHEITVPDIVALLS